MHGRSETAIDMAFGDTTITTHREEVMGKLGMIRQAISFLILALAMASNATAQTNASQDSVHSGRYEKGLETLGKITGASGAQVVEGAKEIAPDLANWTIEFAYGEVLSRPALDLRSREFATIAALTAMGSYPSLLKVHINAGLRVGCKPEEIVEVILQMSVYAGFPASITGINIAKEVFREKGITLRKD
jgi:4-carboxymuconolactone decarboxylase